MRRKEELRCRTSLMLSSGRTGIGHAIWSLHQRNFECKSNITCQLRPDMSIDAVSQFLITVGQLPFAEATYAQRDTAATDTHTTKVPNDGALDAGQLRHIGITVKR